jgi:hypothetical protein
MSLVIIGKYDQISIIGGESVLREYVTGIDFRF